MSYLLIIENDLNYLEQHIPSAINIPYRTLASPEKIIRPKDEMKRLLENRGISTKEEIITYCGSVGTLSGLAYYVKIHRFTKCKTVRPFV